MTREKDIGGFFNFIWKHFQVFLQKTILSVNFFLKNELLNHAGDAAFFPPVGYTCISFDTHFF